jgi:hypothetical protein
MWFQVTNPDGTHAWLKEEACTRVCLPLKDERKASPTVKCRIEVGGSFHYVQEDMNTIMEILK